MIDYDAYCRKVQATNPHWDLSERFRTLAHARYGLKMAHRATRANQRADALEKELKRLRARYTPEEIETAAIAMFTATKGITHGDFKLLHPDVQQGMRMMALAALVSVRR